MTTHEKTGRRVGATVAGRPRSIPPGRNPHTMTTEPQIPSLGRPLTETERSMLRYALDQAQDQIWSRGGFTDEDQAAVTSLRRLADEAQQPGTQPLVSTAPLAAGLPLVKGNCPACNSASLFLGNGGYVTCSRIDCPEPDAASTVLERREVNEAQQQEPSVHGESVAHLAGCPGKGQSATRREIVHGCPPDGSGLTPCCGRTPFELPLGDRISSEARVTCAGTAVDARQDGAQDRD